MQRAKGKAPSQTTAAHNAAPAPNTLTGYVASRNTFDVLDDISKEHFEVPLVVTFGSINSDGDLLHQSNE